MNNYDCPCINVRFDKVVKPPCGIDDCFHRGGALCDLCGNTGKKRDAMIDMTAEARAKRICADWGWFPKEVYEGVIREIREAEERGFRDGIERCKEMFYGNKPGERADGYWLDKLDALLKERQLAKEPQ